MPSYTLADVLERYPAPESAQVVPWEPRRWKTPELRGWDDVIDALAEQSGSTTGNATITRDMVRDFADTDDPRKLLIAAMIWGFGPRPYGPYRTSKMINGTRADKTVVEELTLIRNNARKGPRDGFAALFLNSRPKLSYLGIAFGTKYLHFAASDSCLVYDSRVHATLVRLTDWPHTVPVHPSRLRDVDYERWCSGAMEAARARDCRPVDIEYALFCANGQDLK